VFRFWTDATAASRCRSGIGLQDKGVPPGDVSHCLRDQKAPVLLGVPKPVGPSQPGAAAHKTVPHDAVCPAVTSKSEPVWLYGYEPYVTDAALPARAYTDAINGEETEVPPKVSHPECPWYAYES
jgi:hypothetical protein